MYQSLHTTVVGPRGRMIEIQIRTRAMHRVAEHGIAAHWLYKEGKQQLDESDRQLAWLREVLAWQKETTSPAEFLEYLKIDLFQDEVFVFTPRGELKQLQRGSTALDFAFAVHTDVGLHCSGTKVNGRLVPLDTELRSGDEVEVMTSNHAEPSRDWLKICQTSSARAKIRRYLRQKGFDEAVRLGKDMFERALKKKRLKSPSDEELLDAAMSLDYSDTDQLYSALGRGDLVFDRLLARLYPPEDEEPPRPSLVQEFVDRARGGQGIRVQGMGSMMFRFAKCCQPVPGERIIGFITRGRGLSIHRADCPNAVNSLNDPERVVEVSWDVAGGEGFLVNLTIVVEDRKRILLDITEAIAGVGADVRGAEVRSGEATAVGNFMVQIRNISHLNRVIDRIKQRVKGVIKIERARGTDQDAIEEPT
jgi:GTP pyrophosphokinase